MTLWLCCNIFWPKLVLCSCSFFVISIWSVPCAAWSGFHWNRCYFSWLHWSGSTRMRPCQSRANKSKYFQHLVSSIFFLVEIGGLSVSIQVAEILKDWPSWYRECRNVDVLNVLSTGNGGTIELLYMQVCGNCFVILCVSRCICLMKTLDFDGVF